MKTAVLDLGECTQGNSCHGVPRAPGGGCYSRQKPVSSGPAALNLPVSMCVGVSQLWLEHSSPEDWNLGPSTSRTLLFSPICSVRLCSTTNLP